MRCTVLLGLLCLSTTATAADVLPFKATEKTLKNGLRVVIVPTGFLMFMTHASDFLVNRAFQVKLALIMLAGVNAALFHTGASGKYALWDRDVVPPARVKAHAVASLAIWAGVISCGRLLAYV